MPKLEVVNANNVIEYSPQKANFKLKNTGGPKGEPGAQGPKGDTGPQGPAGPQGIQGEKGDKGTQGERGPQGIQGPQGPQGIQGPKGDKGDKGSTGATGPQGPQGPAGQNGTNGQDGADGFSPVATVTQEGLNAEISITDKNGTTTATVPGFGVQVVESLPATGSSNVIYLERDSNSASGTNISIADAVQAPLKSLEIHGNTSQQTYTGKNLFHVTNKTLHQVTMKVNGDGSINLNGTTDAYTYFINETKPLSLMENGATYTCSWSGIASLPTGVEIRLGIDSNGSWIRNLMSAMSGSTSSRTFTANTTGGDSIRCEVYVANGTTVNISNLKIQLEKGGSVTDFEPYVGGVPAPNPDYPQAVQTVTGENVVKISDGQGNEQSYDVNLGKNLFNNDTATDAYIESDGTLTPNPVWRASQLIKVNPNTSYVWHGESYGTPNQVEWAGYDSSGAFISGQFRQVNNVTSTIITTGANTEYLRVGYRSDKLMNMQLEKGSQATSYAAYFEPIELCKIGTYQDYIYKSGGKWYVHKEIGHTLYTGNVYGIAANNNSGETTASATGAFFVWGGYAGLMSENLGTLNDGAISGNADANAMTSGTFATRSGTPDRLYFRNTAYIGKTGNEMKAILSGNIGGASIWYALATPTDTEITNEALVAQLEAILAGGTQAGANTITLAPSAGATGTLEVEYYDSYDSYLWVNNRWEKFAHLG